MQYTEQNEIPGLLIFIDLKQKTFYTISWKYIYQTRDFLNFGISIQNWIQTFKFYNDIKSCVIQNGIASDYVFLKKDVGRVRWPSFPIFLLSADVFFFLILIRNKRNILGTYNWWSRIKTFAICWWRLNTIWWITLVNGWYFKRT